jgi:hypothetical protein
MKAEEWPQSQGTYSLLLEGDTADIDIYIYIARYYILIHNKGVSPVTV